MRLVAVALHRDIPLLLEGPVHAAVVLVPVLGVLREETESTVQPTTIWPIFTKSYGIFLFKRKIKRFCILRAMGKRGK